MQMYTAAAHVEMAETAPGYEVHMEHPTLDWGKLVQVSSDDGSAHTSADFLRAALIQTAVFRGSIPDHTYVHMAARDGHCCSA